MAVLQTSMHSVILFFVNFEKCEEKGKDKKPDKKTQFPSLQIRDNTIP